MATIKDKTILLFLTVIISQFAISRSLHLQAFDQRGEINDIIDSAYIHIIYRFEQKAVMEDAPIIIKDTMALDVGNEWSFYYNLYKRRNDSLKLVKGNKVRDRIQSVTLLKDPMSILELKNMEAEIFDEKKDDSFLLFKNRKSDRLIVFDKISEELNVLFDETIPPFKWTIKEDTCTILDYPCTLASTSFRGRTYKVWFTMDIPINEGPWKLYGLPGLILKAETQDDLFKFVAIGIEKLDNKRIELQNSKNAHMCKNINQFLDLRRKRNKDILVGVFDERKLVLFHKQNPLIKNELELTP
ncbi:MAG: GLPGLI family protein [Tissierellia bacterium]|jgi:GLPGLI family protein|nr:GLPGLI family protein [Tissierellia bacterium]